MQNEEKLLQVGDVIYSESYGKITGKYTIDRITNTLAFSGMTKFKRCYTSPTYIRTVVSGGRWSSGSYSLETDELKERAKYQMALTKVKTTNWDSLPKDKLIEIASIIKNIKA